MTQNADFAIRLVSTLNKAQLNALYKACVRETAGRTNGELLIAAEIELIKTDKFVAAVKMYRDRKGISLAEAKWACDVFRERWLKEKSNG